MCKNCGKSGCSGCGGAKKPIHQRLIQKVQAVTQGRGVPAENQGATSLKKPRRVFVPPPKAPKMKPKKHVLR